MPAFLIAAALAAAAALAPHGASALGLEATRFLGQLSVPQVVARLIRAMFGLAGVAALAMFVYGGVLIMVSGGEDGVKKGRAVLMNATIGLAAMFLSYAAVTFVLGILGKAGNA
jgi:hypothetical protein